MLKNLACRIVSQRWHQSDKCAAILAAAIQSSSCDGLQSLRQTNGLSSALSSPCRIPSIGKSGWREYSTGAWGLKASSPLSQGTAAQPVDQHPCDINPDDLVINYSQHLKPKPALDSHTLRFGAEYTDYMLQITWRARVGWGIPSIDPLAPVTVHPCAQVLHYAMGCFEGMKAFKTRDGEIRLFRPEMNMTRLLRSATRLAMPSFEKDNLLECIKALIRLEKDWIPDKEGFSLYIRPTLVSTTPHLGVGAPTEVMFFCVLSPVGPYFAGGLEPIRLFVDKTHVRAFPGGVGDAKIGGNYAPTIMPQMRGAELGCDQVLYVLDDGKDGGVVGECGAMNVFFLFKKGSELELVTPPLDGVILPGVTRDSVLTLTKSFGGIKVSERKLMWNEVEDANQKGELLEVFGTGTACIVQPIAGLVMEDNRELRIPVDQSAVAYWTQKPAGSSLQAPKPDELFSLCGRLTRGITDIQYGHTNSPWSVPMH